MGKNKKSRVNVVYSTSQSYDYDYDDHEEETLPVNEQHLKLLLEKKGRAGKTASIVDGFKGTEEDLKELAKRLKSKCATGGNAKEGQIIIQGDFRDKLMVILEKDGYKVKKVGG